MVDVPSITTTHLSSISLPFSIPHISAQSETSRNANPSSIELVPDISGAPSSSVVHSRKSTSDLPSNPICSPPSVHFQGVVTRSRSNKLRLLPPTIPPSRSPAHVSPPSPLPPSQATFLPSPIPTHNPHPSSSSVLVAVTPPAPLSHNSQGSVPSPISQPREDSSSQVFRPPGFLAPFMEPVVLRTDMFSSVINLSVITPSIPQLEVLSFGLNFCPVPHQVDILQLKEDFQRFSRNLRLREYFSNQDSSPYVPNPFKAQSTFTPSTNRCRFLDTYISAVESQIFAALEEQAPFYKNLNSAQSKALLELRSNRQIVIREADKGSGEFEEFEA